MTRWLSFFCGLTILGSAQAQKPASQVQQTPKARPTVEVAPLAVAGDGKIVLDASEPRGLRLTGGGEGKSGMLRLEWGAPRARLGEAMAKLSGQPADAQLRCTEHAGESLCFPAQEASWRADLGGASSGVAKPALLFAPDGRFYNYRLTFPRGEFEKVCSALAAALGAPANDEQSKAQDRTGADFEQRQVSWKLRHTAVVLQEKYPLNLDVSAVNVFYIPIAETTQ